jgi:hypothetical protein
MLGIFPAPKAAAGAGRTRRTKHAMRSREPEFPDDRPILAIGFEGGLSVVSNLK